MDWPTFSSTDTPIDQLVKLSRYYGSDPEMVIAGGGNTSVKIGDRLFVKGSGFALASIPPEGFVELDRTKLQKLLDSQLPADRDAREDEFKKQVMASRLCPEKGQRPSVEAVLHHLMPGQFVVHSHATIVNMFTCCATGQQLVHDILGDAAIWIANVDPGFVLAQTLSDALNAFKTRTGHACPRAILMQNHGLVACGDTPEQVKADTDWVIAKLMAHLEQTSPIHPLPTSPKGEEKESPPRWGRVREGVGSPAGSAATSALPCLADAFGPAILRDPVEARRQINIIAPALRGILATADTLKVVTFDDSPAILQLVDGQHGPETTAGGPLSPDQIVYTKSYPMWFDSKAGEDAKATVQRLKDAVQKHVANTRFPPLVVLVKGVGMFSVGDDFAAADTVRLVYTDAVKVMAGARRLGEVRYLTADFREFIENWEVESYRRAVSAAGKSRGRTAGRIGIVTGAAQGFGLEISQQFADQGGHIILTDMNADGARKAAAGIVEKHGTGRSAGLAVNVTDGASVDEMIHQVVRTYGGFDVFISNAGVLKAGSVKTLSEKDFDFVTSVNYKGFFVCTQKASQVLAIQRLAKSDYWSDIIQINSKSGLRGSNKNGAYAGGKFGGIGLVESFALELVDDGIKVNAICPGNFYDGPLWSDPKNGLFVQYLSTGKVPGAKTIEDVRKFYEAQAPIRRGCTTPDVMKAVYYLIDQQYETGQALPVTGGQVMLK